MLRYGWRMTALAICSAHSLFASAEIMSSWTLERAVLEGSTVPDSYPIQSLLPAPSSPLRVYINDAGLFAFSDIGLDEESNLQSRLIAGYANDTDRRIIAAYEDALPNTLDAYTSGCDLMTLTNYSLCYVNGVSNDGIVGFSSLAFGIGGTAYTVLFEHDYDEMETAARFWHASTGAMFINAPNDVRFSLASSAGNWLFMNELPVGGGPCPMDARDFGFGHCDDFDCAEWLTVPGVEEDFDTTCGPVTFIASDGGVPTIAWHGMSQTATAFQTEPEAFPTTIVFVETDAEPPLNFVCVAQQGDVAPGTAAADEEFELVSGTFERFGQIDVLDAGGAARVLFSAKIQYSEPAPELAVCQGVFLWTYPSTLELVYMLRVDSDTCYDDSMELRAMFGKIGSDYVMYVLEKYTSRLSYAKISTRQWQPVLCGTSVVVGEETYTFSPATFDANQDGRVALLGTSTEVGSAIIIANHVGGCTGRLAGDMNCDGLVNNFDIDPYVTALLYPVDYRRQFPCCDPVCAGDITGDGLFNNFDNQPFSDCIASVPAPGDPCP